MSLCDEQIVDVGIERSHRENVSVNLSQQEKILLAQGQLANIPRGTIWVGKQIQSDNVDVWFYELIESSEGGFFFEEKINPITLTIAGSSTRGAYPFAYNEEFYVLVYSRGNDNHRLYQIDPLTGQELSATDLDGRGKMYSPHRDGSGKIYVSENQYFRAYNSIEDFINNDFFASYAVGSSSLARITDRIGRNNAQAFATASSDFSYFDGEMNHQFDGSVGTLQPGYSQIQQNNGIYMTEESIYTSSAGANQSVFRSVLPGGNVWAVGPHGGGVRPMIERGDFFYYSQMISGDLHVKKLDKDTGALVDQVLADENGNSPYSSVLLDNGIVVMACPPRIVAFDVDNFKTVATATIATSIRHIAAFPISNYTVR